MLNTCGLKKGDKVLAITSSLEYKVGDIFTIMFKDLNNNWYIEESKSFCLTDKTLSIDFCSLNYPSIHEDNPQLRAMCAAYKSLFNKYSALQKILLTAKLILEAGSQ